MEASAAYPILAMKICLSPTALPRKPERYPDHGQGNQPFDGLIGNPEPEQLFLALIQRPDPLSWRKFDPTGHVSDL